MIRFVDVVASLVGLMIIWPLLLLIALFVYYETGSPVFMQLRVGLKQEPFTIYKFRTMHIGTNNVATHLINESAITKTGRFLRRTRMDELLQLFNVLRGEMSLVGPRPCLFNQTELVEERERMGVFEVRPGLTGLAQISGVDMSDAKRLVSIEVRMIQDMSILNYFKYIYLTLLGRLF